MDFVLQADVFYLVQLLFDCLCTEVHDCSDVLNNGHNTSGVYGIYLVKARKSIKVYCDMETDGGGGWLVRARVDYLSTNGEPNF